MTRARSKTKTELFGLRARYPEALRSVLRHAFSGLIGSVLVITAQADPCCSAISTSPSQSAKQALRQAQAQFEKAPDEPGTAWHFARATFDCADLATNKAEKAKLAEQGIAACRRALTNQSDSAPLHYYLGLNLGQLASTKTLGALKLVNQMERELLAAKKLDSNFDYGGADRSLGLLYRDAPGFMSVGSRAHAREHLLRAVSLAPSYPENRLNLVETYLQWKDRYGALQELKDLEAKLPAAHTNFTGQAWASSWKDWDARLDAARKSLEQPVRISKQ